MKKAILFLAMGVCLRGQGNSSCSGHAIIAFTASGTTTIIPATANTNIHLCVADLSTTPTVGIKFVSIGTGGKDLTGVYANAAQLTHDFQGQTVGLGLGLGINLSGASAGGGTVNYYITTGY